MPKLPNTNLWLCGHVMADLVSEGAGVGSGEGKETMVYEAVVMFIHCAMQPYKGPLLQLWWGMFVLTTKHSLHRQCC